MLTVSIILTDAARWWGVLAGIVCLNGLLRELLPIHMVPRDRLPYTYRLATAFTALFLLLLGGLMPLFTPYPNEAQALFPFLAPVGWWAVASAGWVLAVRYCSSLTVARWVATLSLFSAIVISMRTHLA